MNAYRNELRMRVLMSSGKTGDVLDDDAMKELDEKIIRTASKVLKGSELVAFFLAYGGHGRSWDELTGAFQQAVDRYVTRETVERYGSRASKKVADTLSGDS